MELKYYWPSSYNDAHYNLDDTDEKTDNEQMQDDFVISL
jgi:hypothetical protein